MTKKLDIARHEAAHAVAAWRTGATIQSLTITGPVNGRKTPNYCSIIYPKVTGLDIRDIMAAMQSDFAGACIEPDPENISYAGLNDVFQFMRFITWNGPEMATIAADAKVLMDQNPDSWETAAKEFFLQYRPMAADAVTDDPGRVAVDRLAKILMKRGWMTGFEVVSALEKLWPGDLPPDAHPAREHPTGLRGDTSPENALQAAKRLCRMAYELLIEHGEPCEDAAKLVLNTVFQLEGF